MCTEPQKTLNRQSNPRERKNKVGAIILPDSEISCKHTEIKEHDIKRNHGKINQQKRDSRNKSMHIQQKFLFDRRSQEYTMGKGQSPQ